MTRAARRKNRRLQHRIVEFNQSKKQPYELKVSCGTGIFDPDGEQTMKEFFEMLDERMYDQKARRKEKTVDEALK